MATLDGDEVGCVRACCRGARPSWRPRRWPPHEIAWRFRTRSAIWICIARGGLRACAGVNAGGRAGDAPQGAGVGGTIGGLGEEPEVFLGIGRRRRRVRTTSGRPCGTAHQRLGITVLLPGRPEVPDSTELKTRKRPALLFCLGDPARMIGKPTVALVGTWAPTRDGIGVAAQLGARAVGRRRQRGVRARGRDRRRRGA